MTVSVLAPYRPDGGARDEAWRWVRRWWACEHPTWQVVEGRCDGGPWRKAAAVADALSRADGDLLVIADADVICPGVRDAVAAIVQLGPRWAIPHQQVLRLSREATALVHAGRTPEYAVKAAGLDRPAYTGVKGGGMVVLPRRLYQRAPLDPRFQGWGEEDLAWGLTLTCMAGAQPWRGTAPLYHLWHPAAPRLNAHVGNPANHALHVRYQYASRDPAGMAALIAEHQQPATTGGG